MQRAPAQSPRAERNVAHGAPACEFFCRSGGPAATQTAFPWGELRTSARNMARAAGVPKLACRRKE
eukprot:13493767-Alexandrium_andersonii.AAC.1